MRKFILGTLLTITAFALIACSGDKKSENKSEKESEVKEESNDNVNSDEENEELIEDDNEVDDESIINDTSLEGKKISELYDLGFKYSGYGGNGDGYEVYLRKTEVEDAIKNTVQALEGMKVKDFVDSGLYGSISYMGMDDEYIFSSYIGSINFSFELDESSEIMKLYEDEVFVDVEDMEEFNEKTLNNVKFDYVEYIAILEKSANDILESDDFEEEMIDDCIVEKCYYESAS